MSDTTQIKVGVLIILAGFGILIVILYFFGVTGGITVQNSIGFIIGFIGAIVLGGFLIFSGR